MEPDESPWTHQNGIFKDQAVLDVSHPNFYKCMEIIVKLKDDSNIFFGPYITKLIKEYCDNTHPYLVKQFMAEKVGFEPTEDLHPR
jgi:hypothetical protein